MFRSSSEEAPANSHCDSGVDCDGLPLYLRNRSFPSVVKSHLVAAQMASLRQLALFAALSIAPLVSPAAAAPDDEAVLHSEIGRLNNQSLLWGPYRPNLYFGVRPRIPQSLMTGLLWGRVDSYTEVQNSECDLSRDYHPDMLRD